MFFDTNVELERAVQTSDENLTLKPKSWHWDRKKAYGKELNWKWCSKQTKVTLKAPNVMSFLYYFVILY